MDLRAYLAILRRRWRSICIIAVLSTIVVLIGTLLTPSVYTSSTTLRVATVAEGSFDYINHDTSYADRLLNTYSKLAVSRPLIQKVAQQLNMADLPQVDAQIVPNTELLQLTVENLNPELAQRAANLLAETLLVQLKDLGAADLQLDQNRLAAQVAQAEAELRQAQNQLDQAAKQTPADAQGIAALHQDVDLKQKIYALLLEQFSRARMTAAARANTLEVIEPATLPTAPTRPRKTFNLALGMVFGLIGGVGLAFLFENLDATLYTSDQIAAATNLTILGWIPVANKSADCGIFKTTSPQEEGFRRLRSNLAAMVHDKRLRTILITSAEPQEGKSTITANLGVVMARAGQTVVVIDCDLRLPKLHTIFQLPNTAGLSNLLGQDVDIDTALQCTTIERLQVITSGSASTEAAALLDTSAALALIQELVKRFDIVLLDTPALLAATDAVALARIADGVVLVARQAQVQKPALQSACQDLTAVQSHLLGVVINRTELSRHYRYYHR